MDESCITLPVGVYLSAQCFVCEGGMRESVFCVAVGTGELAVVVRDCVDVMLSSGTRARASWVGEEGKVGKQREGGKGVSRQSFCLVVV